VFTIRELSEAKKKGRRERGNSYPLIKEKEGKGRSAKPSRPEEDRQKDNIIVTSGKKGGQEPDLRLLVLEGESQEEMEEGKRNTQFKRLERKPILRDTRHGSWHTKLEVEMRETKKKLLSKMETYNTPVASLLGTKNAGAGRSSNAG